MRNYKWNESKHLQGPFWDPATNDLNYDEVADRSDSSVIAHRSGIHIDRVVEALCRVVTELVEIEENRSKE